MAQEPEKLNEELESLIRHEEVRMLYENMPFSTLAISISSVTMFFALYNHVESTKLLTTWITVTLFWVTVRAWDAYQYSHADNVSQKKPVWGRRFLIGSSFAGFWWGLLSWLCIVNFILPMENHCLFSCPHIRTTRAPTILRK